MKKFFLAAFAAVLAVVLTGCAYGGYYRGDLHPRPVQRVVIVQPAPVVVQPTPVAIVYDCGYGLQYDPCYRSIPIFKVRIGGIWHRHSHDSWGKHHHNPHRNNHGDRQYHRR